MRLAAWRGAIPRSGTSACEPSGARRSRRCLRHGVDPDVLWKMLTGDAAEPHACDARGRVERDDLTVSVNTGVRPARCDDADWMSKRLPEGAFEGGLNGRASAGTTGTLNAPAGVARAAIAQGGTETAPGHRFRESAQSEPWVPHHHGGA